MQTVAKYKKGTIQEEREMNISRESYLRISEFLLSRETDIAWNNEDFGHLRDVFKEIFEREAKT
jgi:hypothetical protein